MQVQGRKAAIVSGTALVLAVVIGGIVISQTGGNTTPVAASTPPSTVVSTATSTASSSATTPPSVVTAVETITETVPAQTVKAPKADPNVLTHFGLGEIKLGMSIAQLQDAGLLTPGDTQWSDVCTMRKVHGGQVSLGITRDRGVEVIMAHGGVSTSEGIDFGSTMAQVRAAYPNVVDQVNGHRIDLADNPGAVYYVTEQYESGGIGTISLQANPQRCYG